MCGTALTSDKCTMVPSYRQASIESLLAHRNIELIFKYVFATVMQTDMKKNHLHGLKFLSPCLVLQSLMYAAILRELGIGAMASV